MMYSNHVPVAFYSIEQVFGLIQGKGDTAEVRTKVLVEGKRTNKTFQVRIKSSRFTCFMKSKFRCVACGLKGNVMGLTFGGNPVPHFNLYHRTDDGKLILFTKDHILPRSKGGPNRQSNYQTMCTKCNSKKGNSLDNLA